MADAVNIGVIGAGTVGGGVVGNLLDNADVIAGRLGFPLHLARVAEKDPARVTALNLAEGVAEADGFRLVTDPAVDVVVELVGGTGVARELTLAAFAAGKPVVTANKALVASHGEELLKAAADAGVSYGFEAAVGGGIPILRAIREGFTGDRVESLMGIINGTANYILTCMSEDGSEFDAVLREAQELGYAEADPTYDVDGIDSAHKLAILVAMAFGGHVDVDAVYTEGIRHIRPVDLHYAEAFGYRVKLLAIAKRVGDEVEVRVHPTMVPESQLIAQVDGVFNAVSVVGDRVGETLFYGQGAGSLPTASAVVGDLVAVARELKSGVGGQGVPPMAFQPGARKPLRFRPMAQVTSRYYLHLEVLDQPGVLAEVSGVLGRHGISLARVVQDAEGPGAPVALVIMTHRAEEAAMVQALTEIGELSGVTAPATRIRVEGDDD